MMEGQKYSRKIAYMYAYMGGVKNRNVGFTKVEIKNGMLEINVSLKGVYTDAPENWKLWLVIPSGNGNELIYVGDIMVAGGTGKYQDLFNAGNINGSGKDVTSVGGILVARQEDKFYVLFGSWDDYDFSFDMVQQIDYIQVREKVQELPDNEYPMEKFPEKSVNNQHPEEKFSEENLSEERILEADMPQEPIEIMENLFKKGEPVDAFCDDYLYECVDVSLEDLLETPLRDEDIINNSFLKHGYYNFRHLLFGRVQSNEKHTEYFIGVPGMYCNREYFMASIYGFNNFKKSHRTDYGNPYFGYWYQEI